MTNPLNRRSAGLLGVIAMMLPVLTLSGCGQKGPLYLPGNPSEIKTEISKQEVPASDEQDEDDEEKSDEQPE